MENGEGGTRVTSGSAPAKSLAEVAPVLYLTLDGVLEPLGRSQILPYIYGLSASGVRYVLVSMEKSADLADTSAVSAIEVELNARGVAWTWLPYVEGGGARSVLKNVLRLYRTARHLIREKGCELVHARSYVAASVAWRLQRVSGVRYLFDARGYWIDERAEEGRWFTNSFAYRWAKAHELRLFRKAQAIVTLSDLQAEDIRQHLVADRRKPQVYVIPTGADYDRFRPDAQDGGAVPSEMLDRLRGKLVIGFVGAINRSYRVDESLQLFRLIRDLRPDAHLLCLTHQTEEMQRRLASAGISPSDATVASVPHESMPGWLRHMQWGLLLLRGGFAKRGSVPTKLAEFFAADVRPIQSGCNEEVSRWVREAGSGMVLASLEPAVLRATAAQIAAHVLSREEVERAREYTRPHFGLDAGLAQYRCILGQLLTRDNQ